MGNAPLIVASAHQQIIVKEPIGALVTHVLVQQRLQDLFDFYLTVEAFGETLH